ncbi:MAG: acyltransferase [Treponema sp.]|nr:acyltransferase [Treponema sp.]
MYKLYSKPVIQASPDIVVAQPKVSKLTIFILSIIAKPYLLTLFGHAKIVLPGEILFDVFKRTLDKKSRCLIAFRHPDVRDPQLLTWFFLFKVKSLARKNKIRFKRRPHAIFVYGYEVVRWGGWIARLVMPKVGAIPIHHTKLDSKGMARIYSSIVDGHYPLALAPEGQVSYSTDTVPRLENGIIRIGFQAASQLAEKEKDCPLEILPLSIHFRYDKRGIKAMEKLLKKIEKLNGINIKEAKNNSFIDRIKLCMDKILEVNEQGYKIKIDTSLPYETRMENVVNAALETAERMLGIKSEGDFFARLYKVRHLCWDNIFIPGFDNLDKTAKIKRSVMDLKAGEAWYISRHQELADFGWYFRKPLPTEETALHLKIEFIQNLWDFANRTMGGAISGRINIPVSKIIIKTAPLINLSVLLNQYNESKKETIANTTLELEKAYLNCIKEVNKEVSN